MERKREVHILIGAIISWILINTPGGPLFGGGVTGLLEGKNPLSNFASGMIVGVSSSIAFVVFSFGVEMIQQNRVDVWEILYPLIDKTIVTIILAIIGTIIGGYVRNELGNKE